MNINDLRTIHYMQTMMIMIIDELRILPYRKKSMIMDINELLQNVHWQ